VQAEVAEGRGVAEFCRQTGVRDIQPRIAKLLTDNIPLVKPFILKSSVAADKREGVLDKQIQAGANVLICNARLVQTGLDLVALPTIVFYEVDYSLYVTGQASRRAWRLIQDRPCKVYYPFYTDMMENRAVELVGRKQSAAALLYGENTGTGLGTLGDNDGGNLLAALASEISADRSITDLSALFAQHAHEVDLTASAWFAEEQVTEVVEVVTSAPQEADLPLFAAAPAAVEVVERTAAPVEDTPAKPQIAEDEKADPLLMFILSDLGGVLAGVEPISLTKPMTPKGAAHKASPRKKPTLMDAPPSDVPAPKVPRPIQFTIVLDDPCAAETPAQPVKQLALW